MTTTTASETVTALTAALRDGIRHLRGREPRLINEATTLSVIIRPTLEALGYPATHRIPEYGGQRNRLDESCFLHPVGSAPGYATLIVEAKQIGADFDRAAPSQGRSTSPDRQIQRYLKQHAASGPSTLGVLTDGVKWRIYRRAGSPANPDVELLVEHNFTALVEGGQQALDIESGPALEPAIQEQIEDLVARLSWQSFSYATVPAQRPTAVNPADEFLRVFAAPDVQPAHILTAAMAEPALSLSYNIADDVNLQGIGRDVHDEDWEAYTYTRAALVQSDSPGIAGSRAVVAAVRFAYKPGVGLARPDTALCARIFARADPSRAAAVIAYSASPNGDLEARLAVAVGNQVNMTAVFDPTLPAPSARAAITRLLPLLRDTATDGLPAGRLLEPVEVATLRQQFYREIAQWTGRMQHDASPPRRQAILRHLIRVMFSWILKETDNDTYRIPAALFEPAFIRANLPDHYDYHRDVLRFLFHQRLNVDAERRQPHSVPAIEQELDAAPFLNGSLFAEHPNDNDLTLAPEDYWSADPERPGLFTVLSRYHWTMDEHRPGESEQTLDPELLSNLFERLITPTQEGSAPPLRQPQGTYYTPADVADEMVKDALAAAVRDYAPSEVADGQLLELFGAADEPLLQLTERQRNQLLQRIKKLRIFDPAVGSGEFLFSMLTALQRAIRKLDSDHQVAAADIIEGQLFGQDINPLAVQIARLRLFIAIIADRAPGVSPPPRVTPTQNPPLPNLEARIVCADTLQTVADPNWRPEHPGQLAAADPALAAALTAVAENRARWFDAHTEDAKQQVLTRDTQLRDRLNWLLQGNADLANPELLGFAEAELLSNDPVPTRTDVRLLFYENPWRGFDIVIGNPPYEKLSKSMNKVTVNALKTDKGYQTTNVGDLYSLFCETALALARPNGGVVTLVVPLSISFGQKQRSVRNAFESSCSEISLRHYDNIPDTIFNGSPTLKTWKNRQRTTIITGLVSKSAPVVKSSGLQGWLSEERTECLAARLTTPVSKLGANVDPRVANQWLRIPTPEVAEMVAAIARQSHTVISLAYSGDDGELLAFPQTAYQFIGVVPKGTVSPRRETTITVRDMDVLRLAMATLNGHVGYAWWWMVGDGFHVKPVADHGTLAIPNAWSKNPQPAIELGQLLSDAIPECIVETPNRGTVWRNVNFHLKPDLIEELDRLHLSALEFTGPAQDTLLGQLRIMRSSSSWDFSDAAIATQLGRSR